MTDRPTDEDEPRLSDRGEEVDVTAAAAEPDPAGTEDHDKAMQRLAADVARRKKKRDDREAAGTPPRIDSFLERVVRDVERQPRNDAAAASFEEKFGRPWDTLDEHKRAVLTGAWRDAVLAADHGDMLGWTLDRLEPDLHPDALRLYVDGLTSGNPRVLNLILTGNIGPGKTCSAIAAGTYAADSGLTVLFVRHLSYLNALMPRGAEIEQHEVRRRYRRCDLLILDDIGADLDAAQVGSPHTQKETGLLVSDRLAAGKGTITTTNLHTAQLSPIIGERAMSRIGSRAHVLRCNGVDRRRPVTW